MRTDLSKYNNDWFKPGGRFKRIAWYYVSLIFFQGYWMPVSSIKSALLRAFGAHVGKGVLIKPNVNIKYPWKLTIGDYAWIGEGAWIDNLAEVVIGANACLSQGAYLLTGNHNYKLSTFDLMIAPITIEDGAWIGAKAVVCPGITCHSHSILAVGSVATQNLKAYTIYQGVPAQAVRERHIIEEPLLT